MSDLKGKVAIVTGASKGIGAGIAKNLAAAGAAVAVNYASSREGAERVVADIKANGGEAIAVKGDVAKAADVRGLFEQTRSAFGRVDVLVNNAGIYHFQPLEDITEDEFHLQFNTNVLGTILAAKEAAKHFGPDGGSIINISSVASEQALPTATVYSATKGAVDTLTRVLAAELGPRKIRHRAGRGRDRRHPRRRCHRQRYREGLRGAHRARPARPARRHRPHRCVSSLRRR
jgi:3-oxoacyl-[acyl-carrier protein] reductase